MHYYLADDTVEVLEVLQQNSGRMPFPQLLKRQRLPKDKVNDLDMSRIGAGSETEVHNTTQQTNKRTTTKPKQHTGSLLQCGGFPCWSSTERVRSQCVHQRLRCIHTRLLHQKLWHETRRLPASWHGGLLFIVCLVVFCFTQHTRSNNKQTPNTNRINPKSR